MEQFSFERLIAYQKSKRLVIEVYKLASRFPNSENFALCTQLRRSIISVTSNLAEGCARISTKEKNHFLSIAYGSLLESYSQLDIAKDLGYITEGELNTIKEHFYECSRLINSLHKNTINS